MIWVLNKNCWVNPRDNNSISYECSYCNNSYTEKDGFNLTTSQCKSCDDYDQEEPIREVEAERLRKWSEEYGHIPYSPGDPTY